ncbi:MAG: hypothetical protein IT439_04250 [Phycisphaerales bacterium]|nr:hypothetical protein [Phycisphaerales bacterium]
MRTDARIRLSIGSLVALAGMAGAQTAQFDVQNPPARSALEQLVHLPTLGRLHVTTGGRIIENSPPLRPQDDCSGLSSHTDANFAGGSFVVQAGFAEHEVAAVTYTLPATHFPIKVDVMEFILATSNAAQLTVTEWSVLVWDGEPGTGILVAEYSSDDIILPHARVGPGTAGVNIQVSVDPNDPEQIFIYNDSATDKFSIGFRIDNHNSQTQNPCVTAPPTSLNAFPCTDVSGLAQASSNWLDGLDCGPFGCPPNGGWARFSQLNVFCRPSGDWVMRASWSRVDCIPGVGACCKPDGTCEVMAVGACDAIGGIYQGDGARCGDVTCPEPTGACCMPNGSCVPGVTPSVCALFGGTFAGGGTTCADGNMNGTADACEAPINCPADLSGSSDPNDPAYGVPDNAVDSADFFYFLDQFVAANTAIADLTGSSDPNDPAYGIPDGSVDASDFFFFLDVFVLGCG